MQLDDLRVWYNSVWPCLIASQPHTDWHNIASYLQTF